MKIDFNAPVTMANVYKRITDKYPHITLFITIEGKGTVYAVNNEIKVLATINTEVVDKTGARDIFVAMVGYGITNGYSIETTIRLATIAESMSKKTIGSTLSIPLLSDIIKYYEDKFGPIEVNKEVESVNLEVPTIEESPKQEPPVVENPTPVEPEVPKETDEQVVSQVFNSTPTDVSSENNDAPSA